MLTKSKWVLPRDHYEDTYASDQYAIFPPFSPETVDKVGCSRCGSYRARLECSKCKYFWGNCPCFQCCNTCRKLDYTTDSFPKNCPSCGEKTYIRSKLAKAQTYSCQPYPISASAFCEKDTLLSPFIASRNKTSITSTWILLQQHIGFFKQVCAPWCSHLQVMDDIADNIILTSLWNTKSEDHVSEYLVRSAYQERIKKVAKYNKRRELLDDLLVTAELDRYHGIVRPQNATRLHLFPRDSFEWKMRVTINNKSSSQFFQFETELLQKIKYYTSQATQSVGSKTAMASANLIRPILMSAVITTNPSLQGKFHICGHNFKGQEIFFPVSKSVDFADNATSVSLNPASSSNNKAFFLWHSNVPKCCQWRSLALLPFLSMERFVEQGVWNEDQTSIKFTIISSANDGSVLELRKRKIDGGGTAIEADSVEALMVLNYVIHLLKNKRPASLPEKLESVPTSNTESSLSEQHTHSAQAISDTSEDLDYLSVHEDEPTIYENLHDAEEPGPTYHLKTISHLALPCRIPVTQKISMELHLLAIII